MKNRTNPTEQLAALTFHAAITAIDLTSVRVMSRNPRLPRKRQAALARKLFVSLGLAISVTTPRHATAHTVDLSLPIRADFELGRDRFRRGYIDPAIAANDRACRAVQTILRRAFPKHDPRDANVGMGFGPLLTERCWAIFQ